MELQSLIARLTSHHSRADMMSSKELYDLLPVIVAHLRRCPESGDRDNEAEPSPVGLEE